MLAWQQLSYDGSDGGAIPWSSIDNWCNSHDIIGELRSDVHHHVRNLDLTFLELSREKNKSGLGGGTTPKKGKTK